MIWFRWFLWRIHYCRLFNAKFSLYIYTKYIYGLIWFEFNGISNIAGYFTHMYSVYMIWFRGVSWHINHCRLFDAKSSLFIYECICFGFVGFKGISTIVGYFMQDTFYIFIYNEYTWFGLDGFYSISTIVDYLMPNPLYTKFICFDIFGFYGI